MPNKWAWLYSNKIIYELENDCLLDNIKETQDIFIDLGFFQPLKNAKAILILLASLPASGTGC